MENFTLGDTPTPGAVESLVRRMLGAGREFDVSRYDLSQETDIRPLVVDTIITYLELDGWLEPTRVFYQDCQIEPLRPDQEIFSGHTEERSAFLRALFASGRRGPKYITLRIDETAAKLGQPRERITKALAWLEETGAVALRPSGMRHGFRLRETGRPMDASIIARQLSELFQRREERESLRLEQILAFATAPGCITRRLLQHFGESMDEENCGHCHACRTGRPETMVSLPTTPPHPIAPSSIAAIRALHLEGHSSLAAPRQLARFFCGLTSPATSRARLTRRPEFGSLASSPFKLVLPACESAVNG